MKTQKARIEDLACVQILSYETAETRNRFLIVTTKSQRTRK